METTIVNSSTTIENKSIHSPIARDPINFMIFYKYFLASGFILCYIYLNQIVNLEKCSISSVQRDATIIQLTLLQSFLLTYVVSII